jgi:acyl-coenzyme A synthetase/AMP-(fatty) acid ligase
MGKPSPGIELAILDPKGEKITNEEGDIAVLITPISEHLIFRGYRRGVDGNVKLVRPEKVDSAGLRWYCTGDRGYIDDDGYFWFVGRDDDVSPYLILLILGNKLIGLQNRTFRSRVCIESKSSINAT